MARYSFDIDFGCGLVLKDTAAPEVKDAVQVPNPIPKDRRQGTIGRVVYHPTGEEMDRSEATARLIVANLNGDLNEPTATAKAWRSFHTDLAAAFQGPWELELFHRNRAARLFDRHGRWIADIGYPDGSPVTSLVETIAATPDRVASWLKETEPTTRAEYHGIICDIENLPILGRLKPFDVYRGEYRAKVLRPF